MLGGRETGIFRAAMDEIELVKLTGRGTRPWTKNEIKVIQRFIKANPNMTQKQAYYGLINKLGYVGHHINNVDDFPDWAGDARNIFFLKKGAGEEHVMLGHLGHYKNSSTGEGMAKIFGKRRKVCW